MERIVGLDNIERVQATVLTVGTYDGVHLGHQAIIKYLLDRASDRGAISVVVTFDPHPRDVVAGIRMPLLTTMDERATLLESLGLERLVVIPFTQSLAGMPAAAFVEDILVKRIGVKEIVVGYDHAFGRNRAGNRTLLEQLGPRFGFDVDVIPAMIVNRHAVSSTEIRNALDLGGDVERARRLLGRYYSLGGTVVQGDGRGRTIGFPTANIDIAATRKVVPLRGVYAVHVALPGEDNLRGGMLNIGMRPTFDGHERRVEVHLFKTDEDLYGKSLQVYFVKRIRDEYKFPSAEALSEQLSEDRRRCSDALAS